MIWNVQSARACLDNQDGRYYTRKQKTEAWQYLIDTGVVWHLPKWYGNTARGLIADGICYLPHEEKISA